MSNDFRGSDKPKLKSVFSASETRLKIGNLLVACLYMIFYKENNKDADQSVRLRRLVSAFVGHKPQRQVFSRRGLINFLLHFNSFKRNPEHKNQDIRNKEKQR